MSGFDVIGDVHGCADMLEGLLRDLGYIESGGAYRHTESGGERQAIFVGDLVDRGPQQIKTLEVVRAMVDAGSAQMVMGNHEFNAISFATRDPHSGQFVRPHNKKNVKQHKAFTEQIPADTRLYAHWIEWFKTLPLWLDLGGIRVVHACWNGDEIERVKGWVRPGTPVSNEFIVQANDKGSPEHRAIEVLLKGPELSLTEYGQPGFKDKDGHLRDEARIRWWNANARTLRELAEIPHDAKTKEGAPYPIPPDMPCPKEAVFAYRDPIPVFYGHYWRTGEPRKGEDWTDNTVCVDFSAVTGGDLVAYRWNEGEEISFGHFGAYEGPHRVRPPGPVPETPAIDSDDEQTAAEPLLTPSKITAGSTAATS